MDGGGTCAGGGSGGSLSMVISTGGGSVAGLVRNGEICQSASATEACSSPASAIADGDMRSKRR